MGPRGKRGPMFFSDPVKKFQPWAAQHRRIAYAPVTTEGQGEGRGSRFNGAPFLAEGEAWPACTVCTQPMPLFLQLNLDELPGEYAGRFGSGLLQLFYCIGECETGDAEAWAPFDHKTKTVRVVPANVAGAIAAPRETGLTAQAQTITNWISRSECCNSEEAEEYGVTVDYERNRLGHKTRYRCDALNIDTGWLSQRDEDRLSQEVFHPSGGDKLGGWPQWIQSLEYPNCPHCGTRMELVFQIDSEDHVPFMFGDVGCGHITQCPNHKDVVTFGWACT